MKIKSPIEPITGGMFNSIPPNPIGLNLGMGYYTGVYNGYQNPYILAKQMEEERRRLKEEQRQQTNVLKLMSKAYHKYKNSDIKDIDAYVSSIYDPVEEKTNKQEADYLKLLNVYANGINVENIVNYNVIAWNKQVEEERKLAPDDCSFAEYVNSGAVKMYTGMLERKLKTQSRNVSKLYNKDHYNKLLNLHNTTGAFNGINIDDQTISLPKGLVQKEILDRKRRFLDNILNMSSTNIIGG